MKLPKCHRDGCARKVTEVAYLNESPAFCSSLCCRIHHQVPGWETHVEMQRNSDRMSGGVRKSQASSYAKRTPA